MSQPDLEAAEILAQIPDGLRDELIKTYNNVLKNYTGHQWEPSELNGGKLCEVVYTILRGHVDGSFPAKPSKPKNMVDACRQLEQTPSTFCRSVRIQLPRMVIALYEIRNNRGVGHIGGDVDPNHMDAVVVLYMSKWIIAELIRIFHNVDTKTATRCVDAIVERTLPAVWEVGDKQRVLKTDLSMKDKTLVLLYKINKPVAESDLFRWVEHSNLSAYRRDVLRRLHRAKLMEYDDAKRTVIISPSGIRYVEESIDLDF